MDLVSAQLCRRIRFEENEYTIAQKVFELYGGRTVNKVLRRRLRTIRATAAFASHKGEAK